MNHVPSLTRPSPFRSVAGICSTSSASLCEHYTLRINRTSHFNAAERERHRILGSSETDFCTEAQPLPTEPIRKGCVDPFVGTPLMELLLGRKITELYPGGITTNFVVRSAERHASDSASAVNVIEDIRASFDAEMHAFSINKILQDVPQREHRSGFQKRGQGLTLSTREPAPHASVVVARDVTMTYPDRGSGSVIAVSRVSRRPFIRRTTRRLVRNPSPARGQAFRSGRNIPGSSPDRW